MALYARVNPDLHAKARRAAGALDVSIATYVEALLEHDQLDEHGRPTWWSERHSDQEVLLHRSA